MERSEDCSDVEDRWREEPGRYVYEVYAYLEVYQDVQVDQYFSVDLFWMTVFFGPNQVLCVVVVEPDRRYLYYLFSSRYASVNPQFIPTHM